MLLRKLKTEENECTRSLWEKIFSDDTDSFLDYYYTEKTQDNEIYVIERDGYICSMLHLNPYELHIGNKEMESRYVVAVATDEAYRGRKYMTQLLQKTARDLYLKKIPFMFLMPAAQEIYYPHDYRYIYNMPQWKAEPSGEKTVSSEDLGNVIKEGSIEIRPAGQNDCKEMAAFAEKNLRERYQVYTKRDFLYYHRMLMEQESQNGGILLAKDHDGIKAMVCYAQETDLLVREPIFEEGYEHIFEKAGIKITETGKKPLIMARIVDAESLLSCMCCKEDMEIQFVLYDPVIRENNKVFILRGNEEHIVVRTRPLVKGKYEDLQLISVDALLSIVFGYKEIEQIEKEEQEFFTEDFKNEISRLLPLNRVFLNEVV